MKLRKSPSLSIITMVLAVLSAGVLSSCSSLKVYSDMDPSADFTKYNTFEYYGWSDNSDQLMNQLDKDRIESAFGDELEKRGLQYVEEGGDMVIALFIVTSEEQSTTAYTTHMGTGGYGGGWGYGYGYGYGGMGTSTTNYQTTNYTVGSLVISAYDKDSKKLIWQSTGSGTVDEDPKKRARNIPLSVERIMKEYPVAAAKDS